MHANLYTQNVERRIQPLVVSVVETTLLLFYSYEEEQQAYDFLDYRSAGRP